MATQAESIATLGSLIAGFQKHPVNAGGVLEINGRTYTMTDIAQGLQAIIDPLNATVSARATYLEAVKTSDATVSENKLFVSGLRQIVQVSYGQSASTLADFGMAPRKKPTMTPAERVAAAEKAKATRAARGTKGAQQKAAIVGNVTGVTITPVTSPAVAPAPAAATGMTIPSASPATAAPAPTATTPLLAPVVTGH